MAALSDHLRRDAEDAARSYIRIQLNRFRRRMEESAKADIQQAIEAAEAGATIDGFDLGQEVGERAFSNFLGTGEPVPVIESSGVSETDFDPA